MAEHSPARILQVRAKLYDLISHCIPPTTILKVSMIDPTRLALGIDQFVDSHFQADSND